MLTYSLFRRMVIGLHLPDCQAESVVAWQWTRLKLYHPYL